MLNLDHMVIFVSVAEQGSFSAAARYLSRSISGVSTSMANLEDDLGVILFERSSTATSLTPAGKRLLEHAQTLLRQARRVEKLVQGFSEKVEESFTLGLGEMVPMAMIEEDLARVVRRFPNTRFEIIRAGRTQMQQLLEQEQLDCLFWALAMGVESEGDFHQLGYVDIAAICSPDSELADMDTVDGEQLIATRQICCQSMLDNLSLKHLGRMAHETLLVSSQDDLVRLVEQDLGWAFVPKALVEEKIQLGTIKQFEPAFITGELNPVAIEFVCRLKNQTGPVHAFVQALFTGNEPGNTN